MRSVKFKVAYLLDMEKMYYGGVVQLCVTGKPGSCTRAEGVKYFLLFQMKWVSKMFVSSHKVNQMAY